MALTTWSSLPFNALIMGEECDCGSSWAKVGAVGGSTPTTRTLGYEYGHRVDVYLSDIVAENNCPSCGRDEGAAIILGNWFVIPVRGQRQ